MSELSQQMEEQKARKAAEEQAQVETEKWKHFENTFETYYNDESAISVDSWNSGQRHVLYSKREIPGSGLVGGNNIITW